MLIEELDPRSPVPLYRQLAARIRRLVGIRALRVGDRLPTIRDLAIQARVNRNTAARAIQRLETEGFVRTRIGKGTFVAEGAEKWCGEAASGVVELEIDRLVGKASSEGFELEDVVDRLMRRWSERTNAAPPEKSREEETK